MHEKVPAKILIVEDDPSVNRLIAYNLSRNGFVARQAYDGREAQKMLAREVFDVVILDIMLPHVDGFRICKAIKDDPAAFRTFVIVLSARTEPLDKIYGNLIGADFYLTKPFSVSGLLDIVNKLSAMRDKNYPGGAN